MTNGEAIQIFNEVLLFGKAECTQAELKELAKMSIKALGQEPKSEWEQDHEILKAYSDGANEVLDKIRAEINSPNRGTCDYFIVDRIEEIIDKYKGESENAEGHGFQELSHNICTQKCCLKNHIVGIIECNEEYCPNRTKF